MSQLHLTLDPPSAPRRPEPAPASEAAVAASRRSRLLAAAGESLFVLPIIVLVGGFVLVPAVNGLWHSFYDWVPGISSRWVGLKNYLDLAASDTFRQIMANEGVFLLGVPLWVIAPLAASLLLYERVAFAGLWRAIMFFPAVLSPAIVGILFRGILSPDGALNGLLRSVGLGGLARAWIDDPNLVKPVLIVVLLWASIGGGVLIFSAGLSSVNPELFEAAQLDGASWFQRLLHIVVPSLRPVILLYTLLQAASVFLFLFGWIYVLTAGGPGYSSTTLDYDVYQNAMRDGYFGLAAAEAGYLVVIVLVFIGLASRVGKMRTVDR